MAEQETPKEGTLKDPGNGGKPGLLDNPNQEKKAKGTGSGAAPPEKGFYLFTNVETQGANLTYAWKGQIYTYEDGQVYEMTREQAAHLNSLAVEVYAMKPGPEGHMKSEVVGRRKRFSVTEVTAGEVARQRQEMAAAANQ